MQTFTTTYHDSCGPATDALRVAGMCQHSTRQQCFAVGCDSELVDLYFGCSELQKGLVFQRHSSHCLSFMINVSSVTASIIGGFPPGGGGGQQAPLWR